MSQTYQLPFAGKEHLTSDIWRFSFGKPEGFTFTAGQYMQYHLPHPHADDRGEKRWFTISAAPTEPNITITTRIFERMSSFKHALNLLTPGQSIAASGPEGDFTLPADNSPAILIAGGIGVTPYHSMVQQLLDSQQSHRLTLIYGAKQPADLVYRDVFVRAEQTLSDFHLIEIVDSPDAGWRGETGQITDELIRQAATRYQAPIAYVSGPEPMVDAFEPRLGKLGFDKAHIKQDWFPNYVDSF